VLEGIPADLAGEITRQLSIPTIGIGAGAQTDGQVLVSYDALGLNPQFRPKFVKQYANLSELVANASQQFLEEVKAGTFPSDEHSYK
jgi:3-methyl-2-oxobutanoate hydroxymethyltransferase